MADLPIPFSAPMVLALLREIEAPGTGKTQTRRVIEPYDMPLHPFHPGTAKLTAQKNLIQAKPVPARLGGFIGGPYFRPRYAVGDRLYVREHWRTYRILDAVAPRDLRDRPPIYYLADDLDRTDKGRHRQGMHMPRWASRLTLIVSEVRVERLQDCSEADAKAEGAIWHDGRGIGHSGWRHDQDDGYVFETALSSYARLWDQINGPGAWDSNPWVAAYSFRPVLGNIDQIGGGA